MWMSGGWLRVLPGGGGVLMSSLLLHHMHACTCSELGMHAVSWCMGKGCRGQAPSQDQGRLHLHDARLAYTSSCGEPNQGCYVQGHDRQSQQHWRAQPARPREGGGGRAFLTRSNEQNLGRMPQQCTETDDTPADIPAFVVGTARYATCSIVVGGVSGAPTGGGGGVWGEDLLNKRSNQHHLERMPKECTED